MNNERTFLDKIPAGLQITLLISFALICSGLFVPLAFILVKPLYGINGADLLLNQAIENPESILGDMNKVNAFKLMQIIPSIGIFIFPAFLFALLKRPSGNYFRLSQFSKPLMYLLAVLIFLTINPLTDFISQLNHKLNFSGILFETIKKMDENAIKETNILMVMPHAGDFIYNLILMAIIPAIGEEFFFRGCIQQTLYERSRKIHMSVWVTAAIFSFIHFEFFDFVPRMMLGAMLGYLFYYSGSIWVNIVAHAFNNGLPLVATFLYQKKIISVDIANAPTPVLYFILSLPVLGLLIYVLYRNRVIYPVAAIKEDTIANEPPAI